MTYPALLREFLQAQREQSIPFDQAWAAAMKRVRPIDPDYLPPSKLLEVTRKWFLKAYYGYELPGPHYSVLEALFEGEHDSVAEAGAVLA